MVYAPSKVETDVGRMRVRIEERTDYPFRGQMAFRMTLPEAKRQATGAFLLHLRIPGWCAQPLITLGSKPVLYRSLGEGIVVMEYARILAMNSVSNLRPELP